MSAPILRTAAQTIKAVPPPTAAAIDVATAARSAVSATSRSPAAATSITAAAASPPPPSAAASTAGVASRSLATSAGSPPSSALLNKAISETLKDTARVVDQTSSEGLEKVLELSEGAIQRAKESTVTETHQTIESATTTNTSVAATTSTTKVETVEGGLAERIKSQTVGAFGETEQSIGRHHQV